MVPWKVAATADSRVWTRVVRRAVEKAAEKVVAKAGLKAAWMAVRMVVWRAASSARMWVVLRAAARVVQKVDSMVH